MENEEKIKAVEKALGEPFGLAYDENTLKTRRNLLIAGSIGVLFWHAGLKVEAASADVQAVSLIFGMTVKGITHKTFLYGLLVATTYLLAHFLWSSIDGINEFRLRATGTRVAHQTGTVLGPAENDYPSDPRQSTLYHWWLQSCRSVQHLQGKFKDMEEQLTKVTSNTNRIIQELNMTDWDHLRTVNLDQHIGETPGFHSSLATLMRVIKDLRELLESERIPLSLKRFDRAFQLHSISQNSRWFILDFGFPILVGVSGVISTVFMIYTLK